MKENLNMTNGLIYSQKVLLALAKKGLKRQDAYVLVQQSAMKTYETKIPFLKTLSENSELMKHFEQNELEEMFSYDEIFKKVDYIFNRCNIS